MSIALRDGLASQSVDHVLEDLLARFLVNVPDEDLSSIERVFFQVEEAQWFYTDFIRQSNPYLPAMKMKSFAPMFLNKCPLLWKWGSPEDAIARFGKYKSTIPVRGVALLNRDLSRVVLVKGTESSTWSFPRGKISKDESDLACAVRETEEETGFNPQDYITESDVIERTIKGKNYKIYLAKNVPEDFDFRPSARNEISKIQWVDIKTIQKKSRTNPNNYFIVATILKPLLRWINKNKGVSSEGELMLEAEIKLKELLGLNHQKENVDAGRELLNVLQGVTAGQNMNGNSNGNSQNLLNMNVPQHLHNQFQSFYNPPALPNMFPYQYPPKMMPPVFNQMNIPPNGPPAMNHGAQAISSHNNGNHASYHEAAPPNKPSDSSAKELLSILNKRPEAKKSDEYQASNKTQDAASNRFKAQSLLDLFNKSKLAKIDQDNDSMKSYNDSRDSLVSASRSPQPSNELEESLRGISDTSVHSTSTSKTTKKLTVLKRSDKTRPDCVDDVAHGTKGINVNSIYGDQLEDSEPSTTYSTKRSIPDFASKGLLDILHGGSRRSEVEDLSPSVDEFSNKEISKEVTEEFEEFEDFEDFEEFSSPPHAKPRVEYRNFDADDDFYEDDEVSDNNNEEVSIANNVSLRETSVQKPQMPLKNKVRVLKQGESLHGILDSRKPNNDNDSADKSLLTLLNSKQTQSPVQNQNVLSNYSSIYGDSFTDTKPSIPTPISQSKELNSDKGSAPTPNKAAASLLSLLGKKPVDQKKAPELDSEKPDNTQSPRELQSSVSQPGRSSARDLLNILKGGI